jgi:hypothetical protein
MLLRTRSFTFEMLVALTSVSGRHCLLLHCFMLTSINRRTGVQWEDMKVKRRTGLHHAAYCLVTRNEGFV